MKKIAAFENAKANKLSFKEAGINSTLYWAYEESKDAEREYIDFSEVIWERDIEQIVKNLLENGIHKFTISSTFSGLIGTLAEFEKHGFKIDGLTKVNARWTDTFTGKREIVPALLMKKA
mgnify:CR=1 FL=1